MKKQTAAIVYALFFGALFLFDRFTKLWAVRRLFAPHEINQFLTLDLTFNRGISWGMFYSDNNLAFALVTAITICITAAIAHLAWQRWQERKCIAGELMVVCGSVSNIIDRFVYGGVVDFIDVSVADWHWPTFNIADSFIVCGVGIMIWLYLRDK